MTIAQIGLLLDIIGAIIIFIYGLPQAPQEQDSYVEMGDITEKQKIKNKKIRLKAIIGISMIILGFTLQFFATFVVNVHK